MSFEEPTMSDRFDAATVRQLNGALLIIEPHEVVKNITTKFGPSDAVRADVTVVDGDHAGAEYHDAYVFPKMLQAVLRDKVGKKVLGRLAQGTPSDPSMDPPWILEAAGDDDKAKAQALVDQRAEPAFTPAAADGPF